jgi:ATP-dependent Clp protease adaptor protein ClpS
MTLFETEEDILVEEKEKLSDKLVVHNDDVNTFEHVINTFVRVLKHLPQQAEQCALIIHTKGKCSVKEGTKQELKPYKEALCEAYLDARIEES